VTVFKNGARDERIGEKKETSITNANETILLTPAEK
jgi:hypothetical protein